MAMRRRGRLLWICRTRRSRWSFARSKASGVTAWVKGELRGLKDDRCCERTMLHGLMGRGVGLEVDCEACTRTRPSSGQTPKGQDVGGEGGIRRYTYSR